MIPWHDPLLEEGTVSSRDAGVLVLSQNAQRTSIESMKCIMRTGSTAGHRELSAFLTVQVNLFSGTTTSRSSERWLEIVYRAYST